MSSNYKGTYGGATGPNIVKKQLATSTTYTVGEWVKSYDQDTNLVAKAVAATPLLGVITALVDKYGNPLVEATNAPGTAKSSSVTTIATGTTITYFALVDRSRFSLYSVTVSGTLGTTNESDFADARLDIDSANTDYDQLLESTTTRTIGTPAQFLSHGVDPEASTRLIVSMAMSQDEGVKE